MGRRLPIGKLLRSPWRNRLLLLEAALRLAVARLAVTLVPFRQIARRLGDKMMETPLDGPGDAETVKRVAWAVCIASRYTPWENKCLVEAMAGKAMLRRRGLESTLYLGLAKGGDKPLDAHAWLRCGSRVITGQRLAEDYMTVAAFGARAGAPAPTSVEPAGR